MFLLFGQLAVLADQSVTLTWSPSADPNAVGYKIYYGGACGDYTNTVYVGDATTVTVSGLMDGATYYFTATTVAASGAESAFSNEATYVIPLEDTNSPSTTNTPAEASLPPTLDPINNLGIYQNASMQTVNLTGIGAGCASGNALIVSAVSSDATIIPNPTVNYTSPDSTGTLTFTPVANALGTATVTVTVDNGDATNNLLSEAFTVTVAQAPPASPTPIPTLDAITNLTIYENASTQTVALTGIASGITSGYQAISLWAFSSDPTVIAAPTIDYSSPSDTGTLMFAPVTNALGTATVEVKVNNGSADFSQFFTVTVVPAPVVPTSAALQPPTLDPITNLTIAQNAGSQVVALTGIGVGSGNTLAVSAVSSDSTIIAAPTVNYTSPNSTGTVTIAPVAGASGSATITVSVNNGAASNNLVSETFTVTVAPILVITPPNLLTNILPSLDPIPNLNLIEGSSSASLTLTGISLGFAPVKSMVKITASSSNPRLVEPPVVHYASPGSTALLTLRLSPSGTGVATVTVTVNNGDKSNNIVRQMFTVTVVPPQPPTLDPIASVTVADNAGLQTIELTGISSGSTNANETLKVSALASSSKAFIPRIQYTSPDNSALLTFTPSSRFIGTATVTVTVTDGNRHNGSVKQQFAVTVIPAASTNIVPVGSPHDVVQTVVTTNVPAILAPLSQAGAQFGFQVTGTDGGKYVVQATSDLVNWTAVQTNTAPFIFQDANAAGFQKRFYRVFSQP